MSTKDNPKEGPRGGKTTVSGGGLIRTVVYLHQDERKAMKMAAAERDVTNSVIMREALRQYLEIED